MKEKILLNRKNESRLNHLEVIANEIRKYEVEW